jgi:hypothetical protein
MIYTTKKENSHVERDENEKKDLDEEGLCVLCLWFEWNFFLCLPASALVFEVVRSGFSFDGFGPGGGPFTAAGWPSSTPVKSIDGILSLVFQLLDDVLGVDVDEFVLDAPGGPVGRGGLRSTTIVSWGWSTLEGKEKSTLSFQT